MNISELKKRIAKSREFTIESGDFTLIMSRPTEQQYSKWYLDSGAKNGLVDARASIEMMHLACDFVVDWKNVRPSNFLNDIPESDNAEIDFDPSLLENLVDANPGLGQSMVDSLLFEYQEHYKQEQQEKKAS